MNNTDADRFNAQQPRLGPLHISELSRFYQTQHIGLTVDGKCGEKTRAHLEAARSKRTDDDPTPVEALVLRTHNWGPFDGPLTTLPRNRREIYATYGDPGVGKVDKKWKRANIATVRNLPGVPWKWYVGVHRLAEPYMREGLRRAAIADPDYRIKRFASFVFRHQRHDESRPLSYHSWGIAFDVDAKFNGAKRFKRGKAPVPWSPEWLEIWPDGLSRAWVEAVESVGFTWGGRWQTWCDPMHLELRRQG